MLIHWFRKSSFKFIQNSNNTQIVIPLNLSMYVFDSDHYRPYITNNKLSVVLLYAFFYEIYRASENFAALRNSYSSALLGLVWFFASYLLATWLCSHFHIYNNKYDEGISHKLIFFISAIISMIIVIVSFMDRRYKCQ